MVSSTSPRAVPAPHTRSLHIPAPQLTAEDASRIKAALLKDFWLIQKQHPVVFATVRLSIASMDHLFQESGIELTDERIADALFQDWLRQRAETPDDGIFQYDFVNLQPVEPGGDGSAAGFPGHGADSPRCTALPCLKQEELANMKQNVLLLAMLRGDPVG